MVLDMVVDRVSDILTIRSDQVQPVPEITASFDRSVAEGIITHESGMICFLNLSRMFPNQASWKPSLPDDLAAHFQIEGVSMSNIIVFPVNHPGDVSKPGEIDMLAQERMEAVRDRIQDISNWLIAIQDQLAKVTMSSVGLSEMTNTNLPAEQGRA